MDIPTWDTSTWASAVSVAVTIFGISVFVWFEFYRPRPRVKPADDQPTEVLMRHESTMKALMEPEATELNW